MSTRLQRYWEAPWFGFMVSAGLSMLVYTFFGFDGWLYRDDAIYLYAGQQFAEGVAPYVSIFDHKTPLTPILSGVCVFYGRLFGLDDIFAVRLGWWILGGLTGGMLFLLGRLLYRNAWAGLLASLAFTGFWTYGREAVSGPRAKSPFVFFEVAFLYFAARQSWAWAGVCAALATWVWQPGVVFVLAAVVLPFFASDKPVGERINGMWQALAGVTLPCVVLFGYFLLQDALIPLLDGSTLFNLTYLDRPPFDFSEHLLAPVRSFFKGYTLMAVPGLLGLAYLLVHLRSAFHQPVYRQRDWPSWRPLVATLPFPFIWTFLDFQGAADLYPFLPYLAIGMGGLFWRLSQGVCTLQGIRGLKPERVAAVISGILLLSGAGSYHAHSESGLGDQRASAEQLLERFGRDVRVASIGLPELLVLTGKTNPNRYGFVIAGIDRKIEAEWSGGIRGFVEEMHRSGIEVIGIGQTEGDHRDELFQALRDFYVPGRAGYFDIFIRINVPMHGSEPVNK